MNCLPLPLMALSPQQVVLSVSNNRLETGTPVYVTAGELPVSLTYWLNNKSAALFCVSSKTRNVWINLGHVLHPYTYKCKRTRHAVAMHKSDVIMSAMASQIISVSIVWSTACSGADQLQNSASLAFVRGIHRSQVDSPHKEASNAERFPFDDIITWIIWNTELSWYLIPHREVFRETISMA